MIGGKTATKNSPSYAYVVDRPSWKNPPCFAEPWRLRRPWVRKVRRIRQRHSNSTMNSMRSYKVLDYDETCRDHSDAAL